MSRSVWRERLRRWWKRGATTAEYALVLVLVVVVLIGTLQKLGDTLNGKLKNIVTSINKAGKANKSK